MNVAITYYDIAKMGQIDIQEIIGDYKAFFCDLLYRTKAIGVDIQGMPINQLLYRTETVSEYERLRDQLKILCAEFVETEFNGRAVSICILKEPLSLGNGFTVSVIELPAPRLVHICIQVDLRVSECT